LQAKWVRSRLTFETSRAKEAAMDLDDLAPRKKLPEIQLGEDISALSAHELEARIARLEEEIARCKSAIAARHATKSAAENFFKR
jgi:uncharacterized small protein (DUF1192 family)